MPVTKVKEFLDSHKVKYETIYHSTAYTAQEIASRAHIAGKELAKTVILKIDGEMAMAVLSASDHVDTHAIKVAAKAETVRLATELEFKGRFPDCETGAMPPFGNLYGMNVFVDESLTKDKEIAFNAGSHNYLMKMAYQDFAGLVNPTVLNFSASKSRAMATGEERLW